MDVSACLQIGETLGSFQETSSALEHVTARVRHSLCILFNQCRAKRGKRPWIQRNSECRGEDGLQSSLRESGRL